MNTGWRVSTTWSGQKRMQRLLTNVFIITFFCVLAERVYSSALFYKYVLYVCILITTTLVHVRIEIYMYVCTYLGTYFSRMRARTACAHTHTHITCTHTHTHTHTERENNIPDIDTHTHDKNTTNTLPLSRHVFVAYTCIYESENKRQHSRSSVSESI